MTIRNVTLKMSVPVQLTYLAGILKRNKGDLLVVRSNLQFHVRNLGLSQENI